MAIEEKNSSLSSQLEEAYKQHEEVDDEQDTGDSGDVEDQSSEDLEGQTPGAEEEETTSEDEAESEGDGDDSDVQKDEEKPKKRDTGDEESGPPVGLTAAAREEWAKTPKSVQTWAKKRERDFATGIQRYAENSKRAEQMDHVLSPYKEYISAAGGAHKAIPQLLNTVVSLQNGGSGQKANVIANLIKTFGVDVETLDEVLSGSPVQERSSGHNSDVQAAIDKALEPFKETLNGFQGMSQKVKERERASINNEITAFAQDPANEFYKDVAMDMADIMELAAKNNQVVTMKQAYEKACKLNAEVSGVIEARRQQSLVKKKRDASSSVGGSGDSSVRTDASDLRGQLENAWKGDRRL